MDLDAYFPRYETFDPAIAVWCVTPGDAGRGCLHRFYDTSPISPSGRYLAVTRLAFEDHAPLPGDGGVVVVDLTSGELRVVAGVERDTGILKLGVVRRA